MGPTIPLDPSRTHLECHVSWEATKLYSERKGSEKKGNLWLQPQSLCVVTERQQEQHQTLHRLRVKFRRQEQLALSQPSFQVQEVQRMGQVADVPFRFSGTPRTSRQEKRKPTALGSQFLKGHLAGTESGNVALDNPIPPGTLKASIQ
ncbi:Lipoyltransferase 1 [Manis pentadactyla]|nr:Lipoyltransferase 1 [Manis pentadactyla]